MPYNPAVAAMRGRALASLSPAERAILAADSARRAAVIAEVERRAIARNMSAWASVEEMEKALTLMYRECLKELNAYVLNVAQQVAGRGEGWNLQALGKYNRSKMLFKQINAELRKLGQRQIKFMEQKLTEIYKDSWARTLFHFGRNRGGINMQRINPDWIRESISYPWSGQMFSERIWENTDLLANRVRVGITKSLALGESVPETAARITEGMNVAEFNAKRVARTEGMRVAYVGQRHGYEDAGIQRVKYLATVPSERTCPKCKTHHEKEYPLGTEPPLPLHPQCRCTYSPVINIDEAEDMRAEDVKEANYQEWKKGNT